MDLSLWLCYFKMKKKQSNPEHASYTSLFHLIWIYLIVFDEKKAWLHVKYFHLFDDLLYSRYSLQTDWENWEWTEKERDEDMKWYPEEILIEQRSLTLFCWLHACKSKLIIFRFSLLIFLIFPTEKWANSCNCNA